MSSLAAPIGLSKPVYGAAPHTGECETNYCVSLCTEEITAYVIYEIVFI